MPKIKIIKLKDIKNFLKRLPGILGKNAFVSFLGLFVLSLVFGLFVFYRHRAIVEEEIPDAGGKQLQFKTEVYNNILQTWKEKEERSKKTDLKIYTSPFTL